MQRLRGLLVAGRALGEHPTVHAPTLEGGIGGQPVGRRPRAATGLYAARVCEAGTLEMYLNGALIGSHSASNCAPGGGIVADGFVIGADNIANPNAVGDPLIGAIDGVRLWDVPLSSTTVCHHEIGRAHV